MTKFSIAIILAAILLVAAGGAYYFFKIRKTKEGFEGGGGGSVKLIFFHATWCPHCVDYMKSSTWKDELPAELKKLGVTIKDYEYEENKKLVDKYNISSFPTLVVEEADGQTHRFEGDRSNAQEVVDFVKQFA